MMNKKTHKDEKRSAVSSRKSRGKVAEGACEDGEWQIVAPGEWQEAPMRRLTEAERADVAEAVRVLKAGGVILYPTDTVWGIGCDATNTAAVEKIYAIKKRDDHKALMTLVANLAMLERTVDGIPDVAYELIECSEHPLTVVYDRGRGVSPRLMGDDGTLGVRMTREAVSAEICKRLARPLVSTSANVSGEPSANCFDEISPEILNAVDYVCTSRREEGPDPHRKPSTVMRLSEDGSFKILRK